MRNVWIGLTFGRTANEVSPTSPLDDDATPEASTEKLAPNRLASKNEPITGYHHQCRARKKDNYRHCTRTRSPAVSIAQTFGAQYAWFSPRVNGKSRESS